MAAAAAANIPVVYTVEDGILACGLAQADATTIANEIFMGSFDSAHDMTETDLADSFKTFSTLTVAQGQIRLLPAQKNKIKAFVQWVKDMTRTGIDPATLPFPVADAASLLRRAKTHKLYIDKSDTVSSAAKPEKFTKDMDWFDWKQSFMNYLRAIPGRNGVPLKYVVRENVNPTNVQHPDFLDDYVDQAPLNGDAFASDAMEVHTFLTNFLVGNTEAESIIKVYQNANGREEWLALKLHYEGEGIYAHDIVQAEDDLSNLFYAGEKKPHMWWLEFERRLNLAFQTYVKHEGRIVHSDEHKLRILLKKINCDWLKTLKSTISVELSRTPVIFTYAQAMRAFKTEVLKMNPNANVNSTTRRVKEVGSNNRPKRKGQNNQKGGFIKKTRTDSKIITLQNGKKVEYHPSFRFPYDVFSQFKPEHKEMLKNDRAEYKKKQKEQRSIEELSNRVDTLESKVPGQIVTSSAESSSPATAVSQVTTGTIMGGRNEQKFKK